MPIQNRQLDEHSSALIGPAPTQNIELRERIAGEDQFQFMR
ncbi:MAG: hypothetical protein ABIE70_05425 [bacterium]